MKKFAVLIDADNTSHQYIEVILEEIAKYGIASVKRVYGDWSANNLQTWRDKLLPNAITPVQQFAYVARKDATDMRLVIDAMDLLYAGDLDGFCIISSDSDFTPLATRVRESGLLAYGFGKKQTANSFINACDKFIYIENLMSEEDKKAAEKVERSNEPFSLGGFSQSKAPTKKSETLSVDATILNQIYKAVKDNCDESGWANLSAVGQYLNKIRPDFDPRNYGFSKLSAFLRQMAHFQLKLEGDSLYVRKFHFSPFIDLVYENIKKIDNGYRSDEGWVEYDQLINALLVQTGNNDLLEHLSWQEIEQKIAAIYPHLLEFTADKKLIRIPLPR